MVIPLYPFDLCILSSQPRKVAICGRHVMASVRDIKTAEALALLTMFETSLVLLKFRSYGFDVLRYGVCVSRVYSPYFP